MRAAESDKELPRFEHPVKEALESLLQLHGTFVLATAEGIEIIAAEERYQRTPQDELEYRAAAVSFAKSLQDEPTLIDSKAASFVLETAEEIGRGGNPERSGVIATGTVQNVAIVVSTLGTIGAASTAAVASGIPALMVVGGISAFVVGEGLKKSKSFVDVTRLITIGLDKASDAEVASVLGALGERFRPQFKFVLGIEPQLRRLASHRGGFSWLNRTLDWIKQHGLEDKSSSESQSSAEPTNIKNLVGTLPETVPDHIRAKLSEIISTNQRSPNPLPIVLKVGENVDDTHDLHVRTFAQDGRMHLGLQVLLPNTSQRK